MRCCSRTKIPSVPSKLFVNKDKNELLGRFSGQHTFLSKADKKKNLLFTEKLVFNQQSYFYAFTGYSVIVNTIRNWILLPTLWVGNWSFGKSVLVTRKYYFQKTHHLDCSQSILLTKYGLAKNCVTDCVLWHVLWYLVRLEPLFMVILPLKTKITKISLKLSPIVTSLFVMPVRLSIEGIS